MFFWMEKNDYSKDDLKYAKQAPDYTVWIARAICARLLLDGMQTSIRRKMIIGKL